MGRKKDTNRAEIPYQQLILFVRGGLTIAAACKKCGMKDTNRFYREAPDHIKNQINGERRVLSTHIPTNFNGTANTADLFRAFVPSAPQEDSGDEDSDDDMDGGGSGVDYR